MKALFSILAGLLLLPVYSQTQREADSLANIIKQGNDSARVMAWNELSRLASGNDNQKAFEFARRALSLARTNKSSRLTAASFNRLACVYDYNSQPDSAGFYFLKSLALYEELMDERGKGDVYQNLGVMYYYQEDFNNAHKYYELSVACRKKSGDEKLLAQVYNNIGAVYKIEKKYDEALTMYRLALPIKEKFNDQRSLSAAYQNMGMIYAIKKDYAKAFELVNRAMQIDEKLGSPDDLSKSLFSKAEILHYSNKNAEARDMVDQVLLLLKKTDNADQYFKAYEMRALLDTLLGDFKSGARDILLSNKYKSKVFKQEKARALEKLKVIYDTEKKDHEITLLNLDNEAKEKRQKLLYVITLLVLLMLGTSLFFYRRKSRDNVLLAKQKEEIIEKTGQLKLQAEEIAKHRTQMNPHFLFNALNALQGNILKQDNEKALQQLHLLSKLMRQTLNNSEKEWISLSEEKKYLEAYIDFEKQRLDYDFEFVFSVDPSLDMENTGIPPMLLQPLLENSIKHGRLKEVSKPAIICNIQKRGELLNISVKDNGKGRTLREDKLQQSKALGIIENRAIELNEKMNRRAEINFRINDLKNASGPAGTECLLQIPLQELI